MEEFNWGECSNFSCGEEWDSFFSCDTCRPIKYGQPIKLNISVPNFNQEPQQLSGGGNSGSGSGGSFKHDRGKDRLLRKRFPKGKDGYYLEFYTGEFQKFIQAGDFKFLHLHVVFKGSGGDLYQVKLYPPEKKFEEVQYKSKRQIDREVKRKMRSWIKDEFDNIMKEIKERLEEAGLKISEEKNKKGDYTVIKK